MAARELLRFERPGRTTIQALVKKIVVCGDKSLELYFSFPDPRITPESIWKAIGAGKAKPTCILNRETEVIAGRLRGVSQ